MKMAKKIHTFRCEKEAVTEIGANLSCKVIRLIVEVLGGFVANSVDSALQHGPVFLRCSSSGRCFSSDGIGDLRQEKKGGQGRSQKGFQNGEQAAPSIDRLVGGVLLKSGDLDCRQATVAEQSPLSSMPVCDGLPWKEWIRIR